MAWLPETAMQLTSLSRGPDGDLLADGYTEAAIRAAVFVDLVYDGRLEYSDTPWVDTTPVGIAPVDLLLADIERHPTRTTGWWIGKGPRLQHAMAKEWCRSGAWEVGAPWAIARMRLYKADASTARTISDKLQRLSAIVHDLAPGSTEEAPLAVLAQIAGLIDGADPLGADIPRQELIAATGTVEALIALAVELVTTARRTPVIESEGGGGG